MALFKITKKNNCHTFKIRNSRALGGTSRVVLELKPFGISIRGLIGSEPWVGRSTGKMSRNSITLLLKEGIRKVLENDLPLVKDGITPEGKTFH